MWLVCIRVERTRECFLYTVYRCLASSQSYKVTADILCKVLLVSDVYPHFIFIPLTRGHYNTIQYNTIRSPLSQSKLEECCFLDKCIFSFIFSKVDSTKNSYIIITCSKVYVCPLLLHSKVFRKFNMGNVISIFRIENKCVHFSMKARQSAERNGIKRILEC